MQDPVAIQTAPEIGEGIGVGRNIFEVFDARLKRNSSKAETIHSRTPTKPKKYEMGATTAVVKIVSGCAPARRAPSPAPRLRAATQANSSSLIRSKSKSI